MATTMPLVKSKVRLSTLVLVTVAMFDLVSTLVWMNAGQGEGNPFFANLAAHGSLAFVGGKLLFLALPVVLIEWARTKRPLTAEIGTWIAALGYVYLWGSHVLSLQR